MFNRVLWKWIAAQGSRLLVALIIFLSIMWTLGDCATWGHARRGGGGSSACYAQPKASQLAPRLLVFVVGVYVVNNTIQYMGRREATNILRESQDAMSSMKETTTASKVGEPDVVPSMQTTNQISSVTETIQHPTQRKSVLKSVKSVPLNAVQNEVLDAI